MYQPKTTRTLLFTSLLAWGCSGSTPDETNDDGSGSGGAGLGTSTGGDGSDGMGDSTGGVSSTSGGQSGTGSTASGGATMDGSGGGTSNTGGDASGSGGSDASSGGTGATDGSGGTTDDGPPAGPEGTIPNDPQDPSTVGTTNNNWPDGLISPTLESGHHNQPSIINGYLFLSGNSLMAMYDISDPTDPERLSFKQSPGHMGGEAEGHQVSFAKYGSTFYAATIQGRGIDIWDITDARNPTHVKAVTIPGVNYGDFTEAVWGIAWQGTRIFVGGTNTGLHVINASDPADASLVKTVPQGQLGNVNAGPLFAVGNLLVITTPKDNAGIATLDISNPDNPMILDSLLPGTNSYIGGFYRHHAYLLNPIRVYDVLTDPTDITAVSGSRPGGYWEYMSFQDGYMFAGRIRPNPGADKINVKNLSSFQNESSIIGRRNLSGNAAPENDDQFTVAVGPLLILSDDQLATAGPSAGTYAGTVIAVHDTDPDTTPPEVDTIIPRDGATGQATTTRIGISFTDNVELATVDHRSFIVRKMGGPALRGTYSVTMSVLNFQPHEPLEPGTTYEVVLPAGGVKDYVGNGVEEFTSTFTTQ